MTGDAAAALLAMSTAADRQQARDWLNVAVLRGLTLPEAREAMRRWDEQRASEVRAIPARFDERYDPWPDPIDRSIQ